MAAPNNTFASPGHSFYALSSESAKNWYTFPSLNGQVLLQDASGVQVLQSVGGDLFFNQELLAKANDIQDIADYSLYPVINPAGIDFNGNPVANASTIEATGDISGGAALSIADQITAGSLVVSNGINTLTSAISTSGISTNNTIPGVNQIVTGSVVTETIEATSGATLKGASLSDALDMTDNPINRASSINLSNAGFAPYGQLTSPQGTQLLWNGATINTGTAGSAAGWANFPAVAPIQGNGQSIKNVTTISTTGDITTSTNVNVGNTVQTERILQLFDPVVNNPMRILAQNPAGLIVNSGGGGIAMTAAAGKVETNATSDIDLTTTGGDVNVTVYNSATINTGNDVSIKADPGLNPLYTGAINLTAQNGNQGQINIVANPGSVVANGGKVLIQANGGTTYIPQPPPAPPTPVTVGGLVEIDANTGSGGLYTLTSAIKMSAAGINSYAGAIPSIGSLAGYNFIYGTAGVNLCAGLPSAGFQYPGTIYQYAIGSPLYGGIRLESPFGIQMLSNTYIENLYPLDGNGLNIQGRSLPTGYVNITDVATLTMNPATALQTDRVTSVSNLGILFQDAIQATTIEPPLATAAGTPNLLIKGNENILGGYQNYVEIQNADTIAFDVSGAGALSNVKSINGAAWPPPTGDASLWSQYPQTSVLDSSGYGIINLSTINGQPVGDLTPAGWAAFKAIQNVDMSSNELLNVNDISIIPGATIIGQGALNVDVSGDLQFFTSGGGEINFSTNNAADINITTLGSGNELSLAGDVVNIDGTLGVRISAPYLDMTNNNIINVGQVLGVGGTTELKIQNTGTGGTAIFDLSGGILMASQFAPVGIVGGNRLNLQTNTGNITIDPLAGGGTIQMLGDTNIGIAGASQNLTVTGNARSTVDVISSFGGATPYSLNTIGGLVAGTSSRFRDSTEFYVSNDGSDVSGNGSILAPYQTIQKAITQAELISSAALVCCINVASGHYTENLTFNKGYVIVTGSLQSQTGNEVCELTGAISIACAGANDVFNRQVTFQGFNITQAQFQAVTDTSTASHTVTFQDCKCFVNSQFFVSTATCPDMRVYFTNVEIQQTNVASSLPVILTNVGLVELERVDITVDGNASAISITGTSVLSRCSLATLDITSTAATLAPLLNITSTSTATHSLGNVAFAYTSAVAKTATNAVYIASGINTAILMFNCLFTLTGTASSTNNCIGYNGVGSPTVAGINNSSLNVNVLLPQTTSVQSGISQIQYTNIQPPGLATYSSTADQVIAVSGTPQALTYNTTQFNQGTTLVANSRVYANAQGNYALSYSVELQHAGGGATQIATTFLKKNGTTIANTGRQWSIASGSFQIAAMAEFVVSLSAGDYVEVFFNGDTSLSANATAAAGALPAIPSVTFNIKQIR